jgi:error-prone DNA polymerase
LRELYPQALLDETLSIARRCTFDLGQLRYQYPRELVPEGHTATSWLRELAEKGVRWRWEKGPKAEVLAQIDKELQLIAELGYESYFLTVHDIVNFARKQHILCQGRGSAANSAVCYVLGITEIDPERSTLLFERFLSKERNEPPDIDVDFEHERREEVLQYVFQRYGRTRAALTTVPAQSATWPRHWVCRRIRSTPWPTAAATGVIRRRPSSACVKVVSIPTARCCAGC